MSVPWTRNYDLLLDYNMPQPPTLAGDRENFSDAHIVAACGCVD